VKKDQPRRALYTRPDHLGEYMLVDYLAKKRKKA